MLEYSFYIIHFLVFLLPAIIFAKLIVTKRYYELIILLVWIPLFMNVVWSLSAKSEHSKLIPTYIEPTRTFLEHIEKLIDDNNFVETKKDIKEFNASFSIFTSDLQSKVVSIIHEQPNQSMDLTGELGGEKEHENDTLN